MTTDEKNHYTAILMTTVFKTHLDEYCEYLQNGSRLVKALDAHVVAPWKLLREDFHSASSTINVALVGKFSSGKSTFINSIMGAKIAPSSSEPTTRSITTFRYGPSLKFYDKATGRSLSEAKYFSAARTEHKAYIVELPCERLKSFSIIDTPGFNPPETESADGLSDKEMSAQAVEGADVLFYLVNITKGSLGEDGLAYLKGILEKYTPDLYIILNQADLRAKKADRDAVKASIKEECKQHKIPVVDILEYSSLWDGNRPDWESRKMEGTSIAALREKIYKLLGNLSARKDELMNIRFRGRFTAITDSIKGILSGEYYEQFIGELRSLLDTVQKNFSEYFYSYSDAVDELFEDIRDIYINYGGFDAWVTKNNRLKVGFFWDTNYIMRDADFNNPWPEKEWANCRELQTVYEKYGLSLEERQTVLNAMNNYFASIFRLSFNSSNDDGKVETDAFYTEIKDGLTEISRGTLNQGRLDPTLCEDDRVLLETLTFELNTLFANLNPILKKKEEDYAAYCEKIEGFGELISQAEFERNRILKLLA